MMDLPSEPGVYALHFHVTDSLYLLVGRLGATSLPAGEYIYLGSALGPGGLQARLGRHLRGGGRPHWHIDVLRRAAAPRSLLFQTAASHVRADSLRRECAWVRWFLGQPQAWIPVPGFGASDCRAGCPAHLVAFPEGSALLTPEPGLRWLPLAVDNSNPKIR